MLRKLAALVTVMLLLGVSAVSGQSNRTVFWQRWDVVIDNVDTTHNQFDVAEKYDMQFGGSFHYGSRVISTDQLNSITNVQVSEAGQTLHQSCSGQPGTYCLEDTSDGLSITYYFLRTLTNTTETFEIDYTVSGALRIYSGGDQLWWIAIPSDHSGFPIGSSTITVLLPSGFAPREGVDPVVTYGASGDVQVNGSTVVATATQQITGDQDFEVRVQYPHDPNATAPAWQSSFDQDRAFQENVMPLISLGVIALSLIIAIGGALFLYSLYMRKGRDPRIGPVPTYLSEPPSDLPPAIVGTLIDERADPRDAISTIIDLAHRGYLAIEESQNEGVFGIGRSSTFTFKRSDKPLDGLRDFEQTMMSHLFGSGSMERTMDSLRNRFYMVISQIQNQLYQDLVTEQLFENNPNSTRAIWVGIAVVILAVALVLGFILLPLVKRYGFALALLPIAVGFVGVVAVMIGPAMPAKTRKGAEESAKWKAFFEYLQHLEKYTTVEEASQQFEQYLPYAVAFGLDKSWIHKFSRVQSMPIPYWYYPTYIGPYRRGYIAGTPMTVGGFGGGGMPGGLAHAGGGGVSLEFHVGQSGGRAGQHFQRAFGYAGLGVAGAD